MSNDDDGNAWLGVIVVVILVCCCCGCCFSETFREWMCNHLKGGCEKILSEIGMSGAAPNGTSNDFAQSARSRKSAQAVDAASTIKSLPTPTRRYPGYHESQSVPSQTNALDTSQMSEEELRQTIEVIQRNTKLVQSVAQATAATTTGIRSLGGPAQSSGGIAARGPTAAASLTHYGARSASDTNTWDRQQDIAAGFDTNVVYSKTVSS